MHLIIIVYVQQNILDCIGMLKGSYILCTIIRYRQGDEQGTSLTMLVMFKLRIINVLKLELSSLHNPAHCIDMIMNYLYRLYTKV